MVQSALHQPIEKRTGIDSTMPETFTQYRESKRERPWGPDEPEVRSAYYHYLVEGQYNLDVEEQRALSRATGAAGNFLVPIDMSDQIARAERFLGGLQDKTNVLQTESGETINYPTNLAHGAGTTTAENTAYTPSDETFGQVALGANKVTSKIIVSEELLQDSSFPLDSFLAQEFGERIAVVKEAGLVNGSGTGTAQGIMTVAGGVPVATAAIGNVTALNYTALVTAVFSLPAQYRRTAQFVVADGAARNLYLMLDSQNRPLWNVNVATVGPDTFLGYPITTHPDLATPAASAKSVLFGDLRRTYTTRVVRGYSIQRQDELHSDNGQVGFRGQQRYDGRVINPDASRIIQHSAT
jgi:HK97 family phage major capsid protein